jgi:hypothetical protein
VEVEGGGLGRKINKKNEIFMALLYAVCISFHILWGFSQIDLAKKS